MAVILNIEGTQTNLGTVSRETLTHIVGGLGEAIYLGSDRYLYVRENGKFLDLPTNPQASALLPPEDYVVGPAVLCRAEELGLDDEDFDVTAGASVAQLQ